MIPLASADTDNVLLLFDFFSFRMYNQIKNIVEYNLHSKLSFILLFFLNLMIYSQISFADYKHTVPELPPELL